LLKDLIAKYQIEDDRILEGEESFVVVEGHFRG
jgi:hypothetical protein